jgi:hypothetical protein
LRRSIDSSRKANSRIISTISLDVVIGAKRSISGHPVKFLHDLYQRQLTQAAGADFVRSFAMRDERNNMDYFLFFGTNGEIGLRKMKEAMWRVDENRDLYLFGRSPQHGHLKNPRAGNKKPPRGGALQASGRGHPR